MLTGEIKKVDQIWNTFWTGGISNPLSVIEQITYLFAADNGSRAIALGFEK